MCGTFPALRGIPGSRGSCGGANSGRSGVSKSFFAAVDACSHQFSQLTATTTGLPLRTIPIFIRSPAAFPECSERRRDRTGWHGLDSLITSSGSGRLFRPAIP